MLHLVARISDVFRGIRALPGESVQHGCDMESSLAGRHKPADRVLILPADWSVAL